MKVHEGGLASSKDVNVFAGIVDKYKADRGILASPTGFTKGARTVVARNYRGRIILWDGEKPAGLFSNYGVEVKVELPEESEEEKEESWPGLSLTPRSSSTSPRRTSLKRSRRL
ncbi:restriction endonuclease [Thermococcus sp.]|uniref:restriction endonuclease n=1 Tax=Thermococcus sp. TaxID=35749 RepID=UPI0026323F9B|nr:restriction endonuclease [Thermococcus sp.]